MNWEKYPQGSPEESDEYLVTLFGGNVVISKFDRMTKQYDENGIKFHGPAWHDLHNGGLHYDVIAWVKKPLPYETK